MVQTEQVVAWVQAYRQAWESNKPSDIGALFTDDADYLTAPFDPPRRGRQSIVEGWLEDRDEPGETTFDWSVVAVTDELAVVQGTTVYPGRTYSNLWLVTFAGDGRCSAFTEWYMKHPDAPST